jgi:hypothetical protein
VAERLRRIGARHPDITLAALALVAIAGIALVATGQDRLGLGEAPASRTLVVGVSGAEPIRSGPARVSLEVVRSALEADPAVGAVRQGPAAPGGRATTLRVALAGDGAEAPATIDRLRMTLDSGALTLAFGGPAAELEDAREATLGDLALLLLAAPLVVLLAVWILGPRGALAAAIATAASVFSAAIACLALSLPLDLSVLALAGAGCGGLPVLFRYAAAAEAAPEPPPVAPALAAAAVLAAPALTGVPHLESLALGGALAALLALPACALAIPAAAALWGPFEPAGARLGRLSARLTELIAWQRPVALLVAGLALAAVALLALPATDLELEALVAGTPALAREGLAAGLAALAVSAAALAVLRRPGAAALATASSALGPAAATGVAVLAFQQDEFGGLADLPTGPLSPTALVAGLATVATCTALTATSRAPAAPALVQLSGAAVGAALLGSSEAFVQQFGLILATGLLTDLLLVRALLVPALTALRLPGRVRGRWPLRRRTTAS